MNKMILALSVGALTLGSVAALADPPVNVRQANQERRIDAGRRSGKLTRHEANQLTGEQHSIQWEEKRLRARHGGHLTARDKRTIHRRQALANRHILQQKHDRQRGPDKLKIKL